MDRFQQEYDKDKKAFDKAFKEAEKPLIGLVTFKFEERSWTAMEHFLHMVFGPLLRAWHNAKEVVIMSWEEREEIEKAQEEFDDALRLYHQKRARLTALKESSIQHGILSTFLTLVIATFGLGTVYAMIFGLIYKIGLMIGSFERIPPMGFSELEPWLGAALMLGFLSACLMQIQAIRNQQQRHSSPE